ncbi:MULTISPECIES: FHA domain-containing protein [unclassified Rathayibacter]|uniref:FHA domain-containing protein n=1 Tax=unclassified Rathayibacter TaxID=2609250 RepID=UPI00188D42E6|nr:MULTISPECIES: FHA domain-containing protein [unclassified Rathayibacter]MBF4461492.1 FHA domain-containing protein [Rathayibacter sp. VKM Ac-2879]MBF4502903.1 FHA domain-containing protein [Rathayibacter sp. VKM Ac-2878]
MSYRCPEGHTSESGDYCDVCGVPIVSAPAPGPAPTTAIPIGPSVCPNCSYPHEAEALFCENCGYDFTTGSLPESDPFTESGAVRAPAEVGGSPSPLPFDPAAPTALVPEQEAGFDVPVATAPPTPAEPPTEVIPEAAPAAPEQAPAAPEPEETRPWIAELWIDPEWYAEQRAEDPMPSPGPPTTIVLRERSLLVGRPSVSRGISPQIDCGSDSGVSRRHCQLSTDGYRWWVEDLQSANGTYVAPAGAPLPQTPVAPGRRRELEDGDRIYVGAWTRIVLREAFPGEA